MGKGRTFCSLNTALLSFQTALCQSLKTLQLLEPLRFLPHTHIMFSPVEAMD